MSDFAMIHTDPRLTGVAAHPGDVVRAASRPDLLDPFIPGYPNLGERDRAASRFLSLVSTANHATAHLLADAMTSGDLQGHELGQEEIDALLNTPRDRPVPWGEWTLPVPLVVLPVVYHDDPVPAGNVVSLDGTNETTFLSSLQRLGAIELHVRG